MRVANRMDVDIQVKPRDMYQRKLKKRLDQIGNFGGGGMGLPGACEAPNKKSAIYLDQWVQQNFRTQGGKVGGWLPIHREGMILQDTGRLRASFEPFYNQFNAGIGSDLPYSKVHEFGTNRIAQRRILPRHHEVDADLFKIYDQHVRRLTRAPL